MTPCSHVFCRLRILFLAVISSFLGYSSAASAQALHPNVITSNEYSVLLPPVSEEVTVILNMSILPLSPLGISDEHLDLKPLSHLELRGWDHLFNLLLDEGVEAKTALSVLGDSRMPRYEHLIFSLTPREPHSMYRRHNSRIAQANALAFYRKYEEIFLNAEKLFQVPKTLILALLQVETGCGANTGKDRVFYRLARLAAAAADDNIQENFSIKQRTVKLLSIADVGNRAHILEGLFLKHVAATFSLAERLAVHPLELRGSSAGAIGMPQFLPGNVTSYGIDANGDGLVNVFEPSDAIYSVANFLRAFGWNPEREMSEQEKFAVLSHYNRSEPYVMTVLSLARALDSQLRVKTERGPENRGHKKTAGI